MRVMNHNWSATKQRLHPQSVAEISRHSGQGTGFDNVGHRLGLATRTQISVCKSPFRSAGTRSVGLEQAPQCRPGTSLVFRLASEVFLLIFVLMPYVKHASKTHGMARHIFSRC